MLENTSKVTRVILTLTWGVFFGFFISSHVFVQKLELKFYNYLRQQEKVETSPSSIILVEVNDENLPPAKKKIIYANLVKRLLEAEVAVVVLNLHHHWRQPSVTDPSTENYFACPLQSVVRQNHRKIVLVTPIEANLNQRDRSIQIYNHLLENSPDQAIPPESIQGFFEYDLTQRNPRKVDRTARKIHLEDKFIRTDNFQSINLESAPVLALKKYARVAQKPVTFNPKIFSHRSIRGVNLNAPLEQLDRLDIEDICRDRKGNLCTSEPKAGLTTLVKNKIAVIGFTQGNILNTMPIQSPTKELIPALEVEARLLASLMTNSFYAPLPQWLEATLLILSGITVSSAVYYGSGWKVIISVILGLGALTVILLSHNITIPIMLLIFTEFGCASFALVYLCVQRQRERITQQQLQIERHLATEQKVALLQAQKILDRVADELHSSTLQELKLLMDDLELMQLDASGVKVSLILEKAEKIGGDLRSTLSDLRRMSSQLQISPELKQGLGVGIQLKLQALQKRDDIHLQVIQTIQPLPELTKNQAWLEAREDIFQFFNEAIANAVYHAQRPHGKATYLKVSLSWEEQCELIIENDGVQISDLRYTEGYGTRLMARVASHLPQGHWERNLLANGVMKVKLVWKHEFEDNQ